MSNKTNKSVGIVQRVAKVLKTSDVFNVIKYQDKNEDYIKAQLYPYLIREITNIYRDLNGHQIKTCELKAKENLLWESNVHTVVNNITLFGTWHRPDMIFNYSDNLRIAIEIKRGDDGKSIRDGVGQAVFYSQHFDFVILLHIDTSKNKDILNSINGAREQKLIHTLWDTYNVYVDVV